VGVGPHVGATYPLGHCSILWSVALDEEVMTKSERLFVDAQKAEEDLVVELQHLRGHLRGIVQNPIELTPEMVDEWWSGTDLYAEHYTRALRKLKDAHRDIREYARSQADEAHNRPTE